MTKQGGFKREARERARRYGQRYTEARAELETASRQAFAGARPVDLPELQDHLQSSGVPVTSLTPIDDDPATRPRGSWPGHYPSTLLAKRVDEPPLIIRVFSSAADHLSRVQGDAEILRHLEERRYPAERLAEGQPVSSLAGATIMITDFIEGVRPTDTHGRVESAEVHHELGLLLGRLHALPPADGPMARPGGAEETDGGAHVGRPARDLAAAMSFLVGVEDRIDAAGRETFEHLRDQVEHADDAEGLPEALTHSNFHAWAAVGRPGDLSVVGWAGSGRGPRLPALAWLLTTAAESRSPEFVDAVITGYSEHVRLTDDELDRLEGVLSIRPLWLACLDFRELVRQGRTPQPEDGWVGWRPDRARRVARRVRSALRA